MVPLRKLLISLAGLATCTLALGACSSGATSANTKVNSPVVGKENRSLAAQVPASIRKRGTLLIGTDATSPPDEFVNASGQIVGWEIDIMESVAAQLGLKAVFEQASFDSLIPSLQAGRYDAAVSQFGLTSQREQVVDFVTTLQANESMAALVSSNLKVGTVAGLCGKTVATVRGSKEVTFAEQEDPHCGAAGNIKLQVFSGGNQAWLSVLSGRNQVYWVGSTSVQYLVKQSNGKAQIVGQNLAPSPLGIALPKSSPLVKAIHQAVQDMMNNGQYMAILKKWGIQGDSITKSIIAPPTAG